MVMTRVLVVDDNVGYGTVLCHFVASHDDMQVVGLAANGCDAVNLASLLSPDVVVMDLYMPGIDGFEATRRLKSFDVPPRVVVLTAHQSDDNRRLAEAAGADAFLVKREVDRGLVDVIEDLVARSAREDATGN
jgi:DNA-binding NarL/FixJ family response regulator